MKEVGGGKRRIHVKLDEGVRAVHLDGRHRNAEFLGDLLVLQSFDREVEHLPFATCEAEEPRFDLMDFPLVRKIVHGVVHGLSNLFQENLGFHGLFEKSWNIDTKSLADFPSRLPVADWKMYSNVHPDTTE